MSAAIERLLARPDSVELAPGDVEAFIAEGICVLFFTGNPSRHREIDDVAAILPELIRASGHQIKIGVIDPDRDRASAARFAVTIRPTLVFLHHGRVLGTVARMRDWAYYQAEIATMFAPLASEVSCDG
jgi:hydrogenase-1 operon protein HyaE